MKLRTSIFSLSFLLLCASLSVRNASSQEMSAPTPNPEVVRVFREIEKKQLQKATESNTNPALNYSVEACRADTQAWTEPRGSREVTYPILVNGEVRLMPCVTRHATIGTLTDRIRQMHICQGLDEDYEKQYSTYSTIRHLYMLEIQIRYESFLQKRDLSGQFYQEDTAANK
jgi:hypothetical protein